MRALKRNIGLLGMGLVLALSPLFFSGGGGGGWAVKAALLSMPGNSMTAAAVLRLLLEFPRFRTHQRAIMFVSCILLMISGGMICFLSIADLVKRGAQGGVNTAPGLPFLVLGILLIVGEGLNFASLYRRERERRAEKKKRRRR